jgi:lysophospholipase L1-like esterase
MPPNRRLRLFILASLLAGVFVSSPGRTQESARWARWEPAITAFERQDRAKPPPKQGIVFVGSSTIRLWDLARSFAGLDVINRGFGGSELADSVHFAPRIVLPYEPRTVVLYAGDNDIAAGRSPERVSADFRDFVRLVHARLPKTRIVFLSIKPSKQRWRLYPTARRANALIEEMCKSDDRLVYVDLATPMLGADGTPRPELFVGDGLHLSPKGYELWASLLKPQLK